MLGLILLRASIGESFEIASLSIANVCHLRIPPDKKSLPRHALPDLASPGLATARHAGIEKVSPASPRPALIEKAFPASPNRAVPCHALPRPARPKRN